MTRQAREWVKTQKCFYRNNFRRMLSVLALSIVINVALVAAALYVYESRSDSIYYASNGVRSPVKLKVLSGPNESSTPLLQPDPKSVSMEKEVNL